MKIKTRICTKQFKFKPTDDIVGISTRISTCANKELTIDQLAEHIGSGASFSPAHYSEGRSSKGFLRSNTLCLDYDDGNYSLPELLDQFTIRPAIAYESFSSTTEHRKWRLIFICDRDLISVAELKGNLKLLANVTQYDKACVDAARLFYGTNKLVRVLPYDLVPVTTFDAEVFKPIAVPDHHDPRSVYASRKANKVVDNCEKFFYKSVGVHARRQIIFKTAVKFFVSGLFTVEQVEKHVLSFAMDFDKIFFSDYDRDVSEIVNDCYKWIKND